MYLFLAFLLVPIIEIALFIQVGGLIGLWPTLAVVVLTAVLGTWLVKTQGRMAIGQLKSSFERLADPAEPLANGAMILFAGALLLTPGFFTDAVGFALLTPPVRRAVFNYLRSRVSVTQFRMGPQPKQPPRQPGGRGDVIDGDYEDVTPGRRSEGPSGWVDGPR
ncbi:FxsA family protein [Cribrihabitans neustonicus]|uniref:FxsA family protein n=1 Tax=Cribrihabitans neustonicus TaxID=1429085 RepID=UPI003B59C438